MDIWKLVTLAWLIQCQVEGRVEIGKFLESFVENEQKATMVVFLGICWKNHVKVNVMKELHKAGVRSADSMPQGISFQDHALLFLADLQCPETEELIKNATNRELHRLPYRWLVLSDAPAQPSPLWEPFLVDSELVVATPEGTGYRMTEIYKPAPHFPPTLTARGDFQRVLRDTRPDRELFRRRRDVMGAPMTMTNVIQDRESTKYHLLQEDRLELEHDFISKNSYTLVKVGFLMLNATPTAKFTTSFGYFLNGEWNGVVKELIEYKADLGTNIGMSKARLKEVAFLDPLDIGRLRFVFRRPALSVTSNVFSLPFSPGVWLATGVTSIVAGVIFFLSTRMIKTKQEGTVRDAYLLTMSALSQQGCEVQPTHLSARIVLWVVFTSMMALYAAYGANIVVLLQAPSNSINNLATLAKSKLTLGVGNINSTYYLFRGDLDPVRKEIARKVYPYKEPRVFYNLSEGVERVRKGLFAYHSVVEAQYRQIEKTFQENEKCDLMVLDYSGYTALHVPASKKSPYLELLRVTFKWLREVGVKSAVKFRFEARRPSCAGSVAMFSSVGAAELRPVLLFLAFGFALSVAVAAAELLVFHGKHHLQRFRSERSVI